MRNIIVIIGLLLGGVVYSQPISGDLIMAEAEPAERAPTVDQAQPSFEAVFVNAFKSGDASKLATYFGDNLDLSILGKTNLYSKSQAEQVLQHFFTAHPPSEFKVIHKSNGKEKQYFIGELTSDKDHRYRVTLNSKKAGSSKAITAISIESI